MYFIFFIKSLFAALVNSVTEFSVKTKHQYAVEIETRNAKTLRTYNDALLSAFRNEKIDTVTFEKIAKEFNDINSECHQLFLQSIREPNVNKSIDIKLEASKKIKKFVLEHSI